MSSYVPPYTISNRMLELVSDISEKVGKISSHKELESKPHLRRNNSILSRKNNTFCRFSYFADIGLCML